MKTTTPLSRPKTLPQIEKYVTRFIYYGLPIIVVATLIYSVYSTQNLARKNQEFRGGLGFFLLSVVLFIKPISILGRKYANAKIISAPQ
jgi:hypothetical protein